MAAPRVVQKHSIPMHDWNIVRMRYAPQMAMKNTTIFCGFRSKVGSKSRVSARPMGIQSAITTTFQPAKYAMS